LDSFEEHVRRALDSLPNDLARGLENMAVVVEEVNPEEPHLLGLFEQPQHLPAKVTIYRLPLERSYGHDPERLEHEIRVTVLHELAHYFGIDEERLHGLGYE
jgi:predicted Zn-dependent protease with MMP-like domain